jgi:HPt (histidine-containing phosphotransfer) domain-containing protein
MMESPNTEGYTRVLDRETLEELRAEGDDLLTELFDMFLAEAPAGLQRITEAFERDDLKTAGLQAHRLRGSAAGLGAKRMQELCGSIEQAARTGHPAEARASFAKLASEYRRVMDAIAVERVASVSGMTGPVSDGTMH